MSRLWIAHNTDARGHDGKEHISATIYYGSSKDSKLAVQVDIHYKLGEDLSLVRIHKGTDVSVVFSND